MNSLESLQLVNRETVAELVEVLEEDAQEIFDDFITDARDYVQQLMDGGCESQGSVAIVHTLKSSAAYVGAERLSELSRRLEELLREGRLDEASEPLSCVPAVLEQTLDEFGRLAE